MGLRGTWRAWKHRDEAHDKVFDWGWDTDTHNRIALVNLLLSETNGWASDYLEIGCDENFLFHSVAVKNKTGVDPAMGGTHRMTSDDFFAQNTGLFDVVFIDGLHEYRQVRQDALNALACLKPGGWIAFHDMLPSNWKEHVVPRMNRSWTGDCWKAAVELSKASGLDFHIIQADRGIGLLRKTQDSFDVPDMADTLQDAQYGTFVEIVNDLPIVSFDEAARHIQSVSKSS